MYCVKCGVELAESENICPLCETPVYYNGVLAEKTEGLFPTEEPEFKAVNKKGILFLFSVAYAVAAIVSVLCDLKVTGTVSWSGYVVTSLILMYVLPILPSWLKNPNPVVFVPVDFAVIALFLCYINYAVGGNWFLTFALPVVGISCIIVTTVVTLVKYVRKGYLYIFGGALIASGLSTILVEFFSYITFDLNTWFAWWIYPAVVGFLFGMALIVIAICKPLRVSLKKKLFI
ncbi:MAG: hypothetical protein E7384_05645 [Ruminococcaceae bacterium]|nr:hypothetical protein [Oscillospiraceae bacterium]